ncbi:MAG: hypothetical protein MZV70_28585 [Desulfobacterales bacterium]|nr:hypothetical protein [Desulfobacterales bacterium]
MAGHLLLDTAFGITTFGEDQDGELYVSDWTNGTVSRPALRRTAAGGSAGLHSSATGSAGHEH